MRVFVAVGVALLLVIGAVAFYLHRWQEWDLDRDLIEAEIQVLKRAVNEQELLLRGYKSMDDLGMESDDMKIRQMTAKRDVLAEALVVMTEKLDQHMQRGWFP